jgi:hypothetical protein
MAHQFSVSNALIGKILGECELSATTVVPKTGLFRGVSQIRRISMARSDRFSGKMRPRQIT